ncbi:putative E3 ubiquitin-protein ligase RING1a [Dirofilaria immitis]
MANFGYILAHGTEADLGLIPHDIICPFCIALIEKFQQTTQQNSAYKDVLCESVSGKDRKNYDSCMESFNEMTVERLKNSTAEDLCKKQKICPTHYERVILMANTGIPNFPTIPAVTNEQLKNAEKYDIFKTIDNVLTGKLENFNGQNLTLHIGLKFQKSAPDQMATSENSTINSA